MPPAGPATQASANLMFRKGKGAIVHAKACPASILFHLCFSKISVFLKSLECVFVLIFHYQIIVVLMLCKDIFEQHLACLFATAPRFRVTAGRLWPSGQSLLSVSNTARIFLIA